MKDRIAHIMRAKNLKASDFATLLGIQPSAVSHILAGRNNPSLEFVKKIKETFPEYNLEWIIFGSGPMTLSEPYRNSFKEAVRETSLFDELDRNEPDPAPNIPSNSISPDSSLPDPSAADSTPSASPIPIPAFASSEIQSIVILYTDGTFQTYLPK